MSLWWDWFTRERKPVEQLLQPRSSEEVQGQEGDEASWFRISIWLVAKPHSLTNVRQGSLFLLAFYTEDPQDIHAKCTKCTTQKVWIAPHILTIKEIRTRIHNIIFKSFKNSKRYTSCEYIFCNVCNIHFAMFAIHILQCMQYIFCNVCKIYFSGSTANSSSVSPTWADKGLQVWEVMEQSKIDCTLVHKSQTDNWYLSN